MDSVHNNFSSSAEIDDTDSICVLSLGERISIARKRVRLNQDVLAKRIGVSALTIRRWEDGQCRPPFEKIDRIAEITNCDIRFFSSRQTKYSPFKIEMGGDELISDTAQDFSNFSVTRGKTSD